MDHYPTEIINGCELYVDTSYYSMWAVRIHGERDFNQTLHFIEKQDALNIISFAVKSKIQLLNELKEKYKNNTHYNYLGLGEFVDKKLQELKQKEQ